MKRLLLVASLPLTAACPGRQCQSTPGYDVYVDSTNFDDGGLENQACYPGGGTTCPARPCANAVPFDAGVVKVECGPSDCTGRRPAEMVRASVDGGLIGRWLAEAAQLEAA